MNRFISALSCTVIHGLSRRIPFRTPNSANLITCITFQSFFVVQAIRLFFRSPTQETLEQSITNLDYLYGYFLYDIGYLLCTNPFSAYMIHHGLGISLIYVMQQYNPPLHLLSLSNAICVIIEIVSPFLNILPFAKQTSYYPILLRFIYHLYFVFRIFLFPMTSTYLISNIRSTALAGFLSVLYTMSLFWFRKMHHMVQNVNKKYS
jgi:hypothetical protein